MEEIKLIYTENDFLRIDKFLSSQLQDFTRTQLQMMIDEKLVLVNNKEVKSNYKLKINDEITVFIKEPELTDIEPQDIPLDVVYEDQDIIVINKPKEMVVHPSIGHSSGTLVNALLYHCKGNLSGINGVLRPGIVHRIDMNTTGIIVVCKTDKAHMHLSKQFKEHSITRVYHAIVHNRFNVDRGTIDKAIGRHPSDRKKYATIVNGKRAITHYELIENLKGNYSYIACKLETGRTHQIRVHMSSILHPLYGDDVYGNITNEKVNCIGQALHAKKLGFIHPTTNEYMEFDSKLPDYFSKLLNIL